MAKEGDTLFNIISADPFSGSDWDYEVWHDISGEDAPTLGFDECTSRAQELADEHNEPVQLLEVRVVRTWTLRPGGWEEE